MRFKFGSGQRRLFLALAIVLLGIINVARPSHVVAQDSDPSSRIDAYLVEQMERLDIPGAAVGVVQGDRVLYTRGYGVAGPGGRPATPQTPFLLASLSKSFTALALLQLVEQGAVELDAPVRQYIPWFLDADADAANEITVRRLLHHVSGLSELNGKQRILTRNGSDALEESIREIQPEALSNAPGSAYEYSNTNYDVLGLLIETVSGQTYESYIKENIFAPLNMRDSFANLREARADGMASGYYPFFGQTMPFDRFMPYSRATLPSSGIIASASDMARYLLAHLNGGRYLDRNILSPQGIAELHEPGIAIDGEVGYGMGWLTFPFEDAGEPGTGQPGPTGLSHIGTWPGFTSIMVLIPERFTGVVLLMNSLDPIQESAYWNLGWDVALLAIEKEPQYYPPQEDFLRRNARTILAVPLIVFLAGNLVLGALRRRGAANRPRMIIFAFAFYLFEIALAVYLILVLLPQNQLTLPVALRLSPDVGILCVLILVMGPGWGTIRTLRLLISDLALALLPLAFLAACQSNAAPKDSPEAAPLAVADTAAATLTHSATTSVSEPARNPSPTASAAELPSQTLKTAAPADEREPRPTDTNPPRPAPATQPSAAPTEAPEPQMEEFPVPAGSRPHDVAPAPDGSVWYTAQRAGELGRLDPSSGDTHHIPLGAGSAPHGVIVGPDGAAWVTDGGLNAIVRVDPLTEAVETYPLPVDSGYANLNTATFDLEGVLWFTGQSGIYGRLDPAAGLEVFNAPRGRGPYGIATTPDGSVYYASLAGSYVGRIDLETGAASVLEPPTPGQGARRVWADSAGRIWVSEWNAGQLAAFDPASSEWREWPLPGQRPMPYAIYVDEKDAVWLSDFGANALVRFDPESEGFTSFPLPTPGADVRQILGRPGEIWGGESGADKLVVIRY